jgi:outer membrane receptor protein involved in Fe transport
MRPSLPFRKSAIVSAVSIACAGATAPLAALAQSDGARSVEVIEVTAQGRKDNPQKIPYNISAVSGDDLAQRRVVDQTELLREVAGASVVDRGYRNSGVLSGVTLRGLSVNGSALGDYQLSAVATVSTYVNQTPIFANFLLKDLDRVEILRGPQGTLYGSGALGGTVRYITRAPELKRFGGRVEFALGKEDGSDGLDKSLDLVLNAPLGETAALRVAAGTVRNAGVVDYPNVYVLDANGAPVAPSGLASTAASYRSQKDADTVAIDYARLSLLVKPMRGFQATLTYQEQTDDIGGRRQPTRGNDGNGVPYGKYENGSVQLEPSHRKVDLSSLEMEVDLGFATLTSATSHYQQTGQSLSENTGFYAKNNWLKNFYYNYPRPLAQADRGYADKALVQELRLISAKGGPFDYIGGIFYQDQDLQASQMSYLRGIQAWCSATECGGAFPNENDFNYVRNQKYRETSVYGELTYNVSAALRGSLGLRHYDGRLDNTSTLSIPIWDAFNLFPSQITSFSQKSSGTLFKANLAYDLDARQMVYGTVSEGFRHGGSNAVPTTGNFAESANYQSYTPDTNTNYEIGIKGRAGDVRYSVAAFRIDWKNIQIDTATPTWGFFAAQNGGTARSQGLEAELAGPLPMGLHYRLGYSYVDAKLTQNVYQADNGTTLLAPAGARLPGSAKHTVSASLEHTMPVLSGWSWINRVNVYGQGPTENALSTSAKFSKQWPGFSVWGLSSTVAAERWSASVYVKNLFNNEGITGGFLEAHMGTDPTQNYAGNGSKVFISQPRTVGLAGSYEF